MPVGIGDYCKWGYGYAIFAEKKRLEYDYMENDL
jgi:hypothetical protein